MDSFLKDSACCRIFGSCNEGFHDRWLSCGDFLHALGALLDFSIYLVVAVKCFSLLPSLRTSAAKSQLFFLAYHAYNAISRDSALRASKNRESRGIKA